MFQMLTTQEKKIQKKNLKLSLKNLISLKILTI